MSEIKREITDRFLKAYESGGPADCSFELVKCKHSLYISNDLGPIEERLFWKLDYFRRKMIAITQDETRAFDFSIIERGRVSPIMEEIKGNLDRLPSDERERYIFDLLTPFRSLSVIYSPNTGLNEINKEKFWGIMEQAEEGTVEHYCSKWVDMAKEFADRLDALLLTYGVDLLQLQEVSGIYLKDKRSVGDIDYYMGSRKLAQHYIDALPQQQRENVQGGREIPRELATEQARKYFARAVDAGLMSIDYKWIGQLARLGYFCSKVYKQPRPINALEQFFNVKRLAAAITQAETAEVKRSDVKQWRAEIDEAVFFD